MISQLHLELAEKIQNQQKLINYMRQQYKTKTGREFVMPSHLSILFDPTSHSHIKTQTQQITIQQHIKSLNLPEFLTEDQLAEHRKACIKAKKPIQSIKTNFDPKNHYHMIHSLDLTSFNLGKELLENIGQRICQMKSLKSLILVNNNLDDSYTGIIQKLFLIKSITRYNFSKNRLGNIFINLLSKAIKQQKVFEWLDLSKNSFSHNPVACTTLTAALDSAHKLFHICADIQQSKPKDLEKQSIEAKEKEAAANDKNKSKDKFLKSKKDDKTNYLTSMIPYFFQLVKIRSNIHSFAPIETKISQDSIKHICYALESKAHKLSNLNFSYCFIQQSSFKLFCKGLQRNTTLIKLNLSNNGLFDASGEQLIQTIKFNKTLIDINLSKNRLANSFFYAVAKLLLTNSTLINLDVSFNLIGEQSTEAVIKSLTDKNDCLQNLGDLESCSKLSSVIVQKVYKALKMNVLSKQFKSNLLKNKNIQSIDENQIYNAHTLAFLEAESRDYKLIEPIEITNGREYDPDDVNPWTIF